jgi:hypothetical protein
MESNPEFQQVMGQEASLKLLPKFVYDGGNPFRFIRDFLPLVARRMQVEDAYKWPEEKELEEEEHKQNTLAIALLRMYVSENVLRVITVGSPNRASTLYRNLEVIFLQRDSRTKVQIQREISACEMRVGEGLVDFLGRINTLL